MPGDETWTLSSVYKLDREAFVIFQDLILLRRGKALRYIGGSVYDMGDGPFVSCIGKRSRIS